MEIYLKQKLIPRKTWNVSVTTLLSPFFSSSSFWSSPSILFPLNDLPTTLHPGQLVGVCKRLHAGWMSAIVHWLFINAYILKHFSPSCCLGRFNTTFHWTINESIKLLSSQHFVTASASEPRMCLVLKRFGFFFSGFEWIFFFFREMRRTRQTMNT